MRILHIINSLQTAGAERLLVDVARGMKQQGHEVEVVVDFGGESAFSREIEAAGIPVHFLRIGKFNPLCVLRLRRYVSRADVVHVHLWPAQLWAALSCALFSKALLVTTEHSTYNIRCKYRLTTMLDRLMYAAYDGIACISPATMQFMQQRTRGKSRLCLVPNGIDTARFRLPAPLRRADVLPGVPAKAFVVMQVGRFCPEKNQACLVRSLAHLPESVHAVFAGEGAELPACRELAASLGVAGRAHFLGVRSDVPQLYAVADVVAMPSKWEGFGLAAVEAMAARLPVVASDVPGLAEVVADKSLLFPADDDKAMAQIIGRLEGDSQLASAKGAEGAARAAQYDVANTVEATLAFYDDLLRERRAR